MPRPTLSPADVHQQPLKIWRYALGEPPLDDDEDEPDISRTKKTSIPSKPPCALLTRGLAHCLGLG